MASSRAPRIAPPAPGLRAIASAEKLAPGREVLVTPLVRELELAPPRLGGRKWPGIVWMLAQALLPYALGRAVTDGRLTARTLTAADAAYTLSLALPSSNWARGYDVRALQPSVDWFGIMTYDYHGGWTSHAGHNAPLYHPSSDPEGSANTSISLGVVNRREN